jgi:hypothetical protein
MRRFRWFHSTRNSVEVRLTPSFRATSIADAHSSSGIAAFPLRLCLPSSKAAMALILDKLRDDHAGVDPYNLIVFSNHPQHYSAFLCPSGSLPSNRLRPMMPRWATRTNGRCHQRDTVRDVKRQGPAISCRFPA